jgi:hypothetical protein
LAGAGAASFEMSEYSQAAEYFNRLPGEKSADPKMAEMATTSRQVLAADPFVSGLSPDEKARRAAAALSIAQVGLNQCASSRGISLTTSLSVTPLEKAIADSYAREKEWDLRSLLLHPERVDAAMSLAFQMENLSAQACGPPEGADRALWLLGRNRRAMPR